MCDHELAYDCEQLLASRSSQLDLAPRRARPDSVSCCCDADDDDDGLTLDADADADCDDDCYDLLAAFDECDCDDDYDDVEQLELAC